MRFMLLPVMTLALMLVGPRPASAADTSEATTKKESKDQKKSVKKQDTTKKQDAQAKQGARASADAGGDQRTLPKPSGYYEMDSDKLPVGSSRWFEQMEREGKFSRRN